MFILSDGDLEDELGLKLLNRNYGRMTGVSSYNLKGSKSEFELSLLTRKSAERLAVVDNFVEILFKVVRRLETDNLPVELQVGPSNR